MITLYRPSGYDSPRASSLYSEAYDPADSRRTYTETEEEIPTTTDDADHKPAFEIMTGGVTDA